MNRNGYVWFPYKIRYDHKFLFFLAGIGFLVSAILSFYFLLKMKTKIYQVQLMIDFSSSWLALRASLLLLTIVLIVGIKLLMLETVVKMVEIVQNEEPKKNPTLCKFSPYVFLAPFLDFDLNWKSVFWNLPLLLAVLPILSFCYYLYTYVVKISMVNYYYRQKHPIL